VPSHSGEQGTTLSEFSDSTEPDTQIRPATANDAGLILEFIRQLADYEKLSDEVVATAESLEQTLFGPKPGAEVLIAEWKGDPAGFALLFGNYSTFLAQPGIYLEDLFVLPAARGHGIGKQLLRRVAEIAAQRNCGRLDWSVLDWNEPAIGFYLKLGARSLDDWTQFRLDGEALHRFAEGEN
jgi:GNAT superfamily N-acetyltransferase